MDGLSISELNELAAEVSKRKLDVKRLAGLIRRAVSTFTSKIREMKQNEATKLESLENELKDWQLRYAAVLSDYQSLLGEKEELMNRVEEIESRVSESKGDCSRMGAVCGTLLWKSTKEASLAGNILQASEVVEEFFEIATQSLYKMFENPTFDEQWMALSFTGTTANLMGSTDGRECLLSREEGQNFLETVFSCFNMRFVDEETEVELKRAVLMLFFNLSLSRNGIEYLMEHYMERLVPACVSILEENDGLMSDAKWLSVRLLLSLLSQKPPDHVCVAMRKKVSVKRLEEIGNKLNCSSDMTRNLDETRKLLNKWLS